MTNISGKAVNNKLLAGKTAIVTGSGRNIGKSIALLFAREGANVVVNGHRNENALNQVVSEIEALGASALACLADVGDAGAVSEMVNAARRKFGKVDIAVSNVAIRAHQPFTDITVNDWQRVLNSNLNSAFYLAREVIPAMKESRWGRILHIAGEDGFGGSVPGRAHNIVCKAGMHSLAKALAAEFAADGITANTVSPGYIDTERDWSKYTNGPEARIAAIPMKRLGSVDDIAKACLYLAADSGAFITGQVLHVNGGQFIY
jgi:NAD(P)-dependent dehydrogenase (short-subunit alcohol dehydrogenase family)